MTIRRKNRAFPAWLYYVHITAIAFAGRRADIATMLNILSLIVGIVALLGAVVAFFPLLGWINWAVVPLAVIGAGLGILSRFDAGRRLNGFVLLVAIVRLIIGHGIF